MMETIDPVYLDWLDLSMLVKQKGGTDALSWWVFVVGMDGTPQERLERGRIAWARWGSAWSMQERPGT